MAKENHLMTTPVNGREPNTTVNMIMETVKRLNLYCRQNGQIRMYVLDDLVKEFLDKKGY